MTKTPPGPHEPVPSNRPATDSTRTGSRGSGSGSGVSIVIPTRGSSGRLAGGKVRWVDHALEGLIDTTDDLKPEIILVVDTDTSLDYVDPWQKRLGDQLTVVRTPPPFNFSHKVNQGVLTSRSEFVLLYNDDTYPITPDWLPKLLELAARPEVGAVGAQLLLEDGSIQHVGHAYAHGGVFHFDAGQRLEETPADRNRRDRQVSGVTAACLLQRRSVWQELDGLDESLPNNFNDVDYCVRIRRAGYQILQCNSVQLFHYETQTRESGAEGWEVSEIERRLGELMQSEDQFTPGVALVLGDRPKNRWSTIASRLRRRWDRAVNRSDQERRPDDAEPDRRTSSP